MVIWNMVIWNMVICNTMIKIVVLTEVVQSNPQVQDHNVACRKLFKSTDAGYTPIQSPSLGFALVYWTVIVSSTL